jgi:hypothetical protein
LGREYRVREYGGGIGREEGSSIHRGGMVWWKNGMVRRGAARRRMEESGADA